MWPLLVGGNWITAGAAAGSLTFPLLVGGFVFGVTAVNGVVVSRAALLCGMVPGVCAGAGITVIRAALLCGIAWTPGLGAGMT